MAKFSDLITAVDTTGKAATDAKAAADAADTAAAEAVTAVVTTLGAHGGTIVVVATPDAPSAMVYVLDTSTSTYTSTSIPLNPDV